ncbi:MAG TPA: hypothetical protein VGI10_14240 [Polyangiaceae bacterium]
MTLWSGRALVSLLVACSSGAAPSPLAPGETPQPSGGVSGGPLGDTLTVFAVDSTTNAALAGARVLLGSGADAYDAGVTGADGRLVIAGLGATPPAQTVTVSHAGYTAASWAGVSSATVTLPLTPPSPPDATTSVTVSIPGYEKLPTLPAGHYRVAGFAPSLPIDLQTLEVDGALSATCPASQSPTPCQATIDQVPLTAKTLLAVVAEGDDMGTPDDLSDDTLTMTNVGVSTGLTLSQHGLVEVSMLSQDRVAYATIGVDHGSYAGDVIGVPGVTLGNQVILYPTLTGQLDTFMVPTAVGALSDSKLWAVATASPLATGAAGGQTQPLGASSSSWSRVYARGIASPAAAQSITISTDSFLDAPSVQPAGGTYSLAAANGLVRLEFSSGGVEQLDVLLLPGQTSFTPPVALGLTADQVGVLSFDVATLDTQSFSFSQIVGQAGRIAYTDIALGNGQ